MSKSVEQKNRGSKKIEEPEAVEDTIRSFLGPVLFKSLGYEKLGRIYREVANRSSDESFAEAILRQMNVRVKVSQESLDSIPRTGPVVVVANHPFGGIEGLVLVQLLSDIRKDVKILANFILNHIPEIKDYFLSVDPFGGKESVKKNIASLRETLSWLKKDGMLVVFPAGEVSHLNMRKRQITDPAWSKNIAGIVRKSGASVIPIYFHGRNSLLFHVLGLLHPRLRTLMLGRELVNKCGQEIALEIGNPIPNERLQRFSSNQDLLSYLRLRTFILRYRANAPWATSSKKKNLHWKAKAKEPVAPPVDHSTLTREISRLPRDSLLFENKSHAVYIATADLIPNGLAEIGRLRELTFREVNEGTGYSTDLDKYDNYYTHMFSWNKSKEHIMGAYRIGKADSINRSHGVTGLYTQSLFRYSSKLLEQLGPSLELGRSFVRPEEQKNYASLFMLWSGIGHYVARNPQYRYLFGPVSISAEYDVISHQLIMSYLREHTFLPELAKLIKPRRSPRQQNIHGIEPNEIATFASDINDVSEVIAEIEATEKAVPILLKQYLKMGGKLLGFNVDPHFGNVLDGLILVDLLETKPRVIRKYMGTEGVVNFFKFHGRNIEISPRRSKTNK